MVFLWLKGLINKRALSIDYDEIFSLIIKPVIICVVLLVAVFDDWLIYQLNIKNIFLYCSLTGIVYMKQPLGFTNPDHLNYVCKLQASSPTGMISMREWLFAISFFFFVFVGLKPIYIFFFIKHIKNCMVFLIIDGDNILLTGSPHIQFGALIASF